MLEKFCNADHLLCCTSTTPVILVNCIARTDIRHLSRESRSLLCKVTEDRTSACNTIICYKHAKLNLNSFTYKFRRVCKFTRACDV